MNAHSGSGTPGGCAVLEADENADLPPEWARTERFASRLRGARVNGWEIALWVIALVLIVASVQASVYATQHLYMGYSNSCDSNGVCNTPGSVIYLQAAMSLSPAAFAAGLLSAIIAVALRAFGVAAGRRAADQAAAATDTGANAAVPSSAFVTGNAATASAIPTAPPSAHAYAASFVPPPPAAPADPTAPSVGTPSGSHTTLIRSRTNTAAFARPATPATTASGERDLSAFMRPRDGENTGA